MTIRPGEQWGEVVERPARPVVAASDADAAGLADRGVADVVVTGGDLWRTVGGRGGGATVRRFPVDLLRVAADGATWPALAHVVVRPPGPLGWWRGPLRAVVNVSAIGRWDVAPRAHPNDGRLDVVDADALDRRGRWQAWRRLSTGTHLPHPCITARRDVAVAWRFDRPVGVWVDGVRRAKARAVDVTVVPDAATVHV